eukprot:CAMPEP_0179084932 /NCGR_PEP_ID=MMETSP0796-20121207/38435_1 /TAXON_ID=73915 /ORGANISM="Pyrodinium bahamense, Strain pbaha01" /LENGTH=205 /DNA_ID=CAMNT_0020782359 /DNA_START=63 /DNA_END=680 /DNA_ORIENTATION=-
MSSTVSTLCVARLPDALAPKGISCKQRLRCWRGVSIFAVLLTAGAAEAATEPWACSSGQPVMVGGIKYKTKVALVRAGYPPTPFVNANHTNVKVAVIATLAVGGAAFPFNFVNPHEYVMPPKKDGIMIGFDVGFAPVLGQPQCPTSICGMTKNSVRMLCIPPEEGYGSTARPGIPANSTLLLEITCLEIIAPSTSASGISDAVSV